LTNRERGTEKSDSATNSNSIVGAEKSGVTNGEEGPKALMYSQSQQKTEEIEHNSRR
jgi:hypothetical protein